MLKDVAIILFNTRNAPPRQINVNVSFNRNLSNVEGSQLITEANEPITDLHVSLANINFVETSSIL